ncbi:MAG: divergent polysaccharide deacetylase family protein [Treponema sp.]|nr:divergent polysaccharide deacetylase family protein [Treponema sp.]
MSATRKKTPSTKKRTTSTKKRTSSKKRSTSGKVYISPYKTIILCLSVIVLCLVLLLINTLPKPKQKSEQQEASITERFEEDINKQVQEKLSSPEIKLEEQKPEVKTEPKKQESKKEPKTQPEKTEAKTDSLKEEPQKKQETQTKVEEKKQEPKKSEPAVKTFGFEKAKKNAQLIFVFDDGGQNLEHLKKFLELPFPITVAVLPQITHSVEAAELVRKSGNEVILHQPMQSVNASINPGPGAITPDMSEEEIISQLFVNINQVGPVAGMNNHEGSGITADAEKMALILQMASENGIYFLDSRTNVETQVPYVAHELGYTWYERNIFLDNEKTKENALAELKKGLALANKNGNVIMIGHIWSADFLPALLKEAYPELKEKGYTFSVVSKSNAEKR